MTIVDCAVYEQGGRREGEVPLEGAYELCQTDGRFVWIGLFEPSEEEFDEVSAQFHLHELAVEDALNAHQRPKLEVYGETFFSVLKTCRYVDPDEVIEFGEIMLFVGSGFLISVRHGEGSNLQVVRERLDNSPELMALGPAGAAYAIVDHVIDDYEPVVQGVDTDIEEVERDVFSDERSNPSERIYRLKREVIEFHRAVAPLREPLDRLSRGSIQQVPVDLREYFRDVYDHVLRVDGQVEGFRDLLTGVLEANLSQIQVRQNEDVRKISAWVAIAAVPTAIAAIYGMNFEHMPELRSEWGYPAILVLMAFICTMLYRQFRKVGWL
ncbi:MAG: magnesium/cobalt transporter CorA [Thermoleophilaceae bacterium]|nr:magnesium/cobalt transporter CorA [Thermoleophilaceae bacterium]